MPKKSLIIEIENLVKKNNELYDELTVAKRKYDDSKALVATLMSRTEQLEKQLDEKNAEIAELTSQLESKVTEPAPIENADDVSACVSTESDLEAEPVTEYVDVLSDSPKVAVSTEKTAGIDVDYGAAVELASAAIGEVVLECTELCAFFAENGGSNAKDLINLALGRTEVFKSDALNVIEESDETSFVVSQLEEKKKNTLEYFDLLKKQV